MRAFFAIALLVFVAFALAEDWRRSSFSAGYQCWSSFVPRRRCVHYLNVGSADCPTHDLNAKGCDKRFRGHNARCLVYICKVIATSISTTANEMKLINPPLSCSPLSTCRNARTLSAAIGLNRFEIVDAVGLAAQGSIAPRSRTTFTFRHGAALCYRV